MQDVHLRAQLAVDAVLVDDELLEGGLVERPSKPGSCGVRPFRLDSVAFGLQDFDVGDRLRDGITAGSRRPR